MIEIEELENGYKVHTDCKTVGCFQEQAITQFRKVGFRVDNSGEIYFEGCEGTIIKDNTEIDTVYLLTFMSVFTGHYVFHIITK